MVVVPGMHVISYVSYLKFWGDLGNQFFGDAQRSSHNTAAPPSSYYFPKDNQSFSSTTIIMMSKLLRSVLLFATFLSVRALVCPSTCPLVVTANGNSNCCSIGDGAEGCGVCGFSSCYYNNFASCVEAFGTQCSLDTASCVVKSVGGLSNR